jgi:hypothetical protein
MWRFQYAFNPPLEGHFYIKAVSEEEAIGEAFRILGQEESFWLHKESFWLQEALILDSTLQSRFDTRESLEKFLETLSAGDWLAIAESLGDWSCEECIPVN